MSMDLVDRLLAESAHLPPEGDPARAALRWAILVEDALGLVLSDEQITSSSLADPEHLRSLVAAPSPHG
jgi:hypothetical protein